MSGWTYESERGRENNEEGEWEGKITWIGRDERPRLHRPLDIIEIPYLIQLVRVGALDHGSDPPRRLQCRDDRVAGIRLAAIRHDPRVRQPGVGRQRLEQIHRLLEEIHHLLLRHVIGVAARFQGADAGAVLGPLVLPEALVVALVVLPVGVHVGEQVRGPCGGDDGGDVGVGARGVAVGVVGAVAVVGPQAVDGPGVGGACGWGVVPELGLEQLAAGGVEAACVRHCGCVHA